MDKEWTPEALRLGDLVAGVMEQVTPVHEQYDSATQALETLLPGNLRSHCRVGGVNKGSLKLLADASSYLYELQLCKAVLLRELQRLCPASRIRRIEVGMLR